MSHKIFSKHTFILALLVSGLCFISLSSTAEIFKWVDKNGQLHFGDAAPQDASSEQITVKINTYTSPSLGGSSSVSGPNENLAHQSGSSKKVIMYSATVLHQASIDGFRAILTYQYKAQSAENG